LSEPFKRLEKIMTVQDLPTGLREQVHAADTAPVRLTIEVMPELTRPDQSERSGAQLCHDIRQRFADVGYVDDLPEFEDMPYDAAERTPFHE